MSKERILRSLDAGLVILHTITAPNISKHVIIEESIDQLISHTKYHLENNIYPEFDPVYRAESKGIRMLTSPNSRLQLLLCHVCFFVCCFFFWAVESGTNAKQKRRYTSNVNKDIIAVYNRLVEVMDTLALLVEKQSLTDITVLKVSERGKGEGSK